MRAATTNKTGPKTRAARRPPGRADSHKNWTDRRGPVTASIVTSYTYDNRGNRTAANPASGTTQDYTYNQASELTEYTAGTASADYTYNGDGLLTSTTVGATSTSDTWDSATTSAPILYSDGNTSYLYGPGGIPIEEIGSDGIATSYLQHDQQGSVRLITDASGSVTGTYAYTPDGSVSSHTGPTSSSLLYDGQYQDATSGLYFLRARYYDPNTSQFITRDPLEASTGAAYSYASNDPLDQADPLGQSSCAAGQNGGGCWNGESLPPGIANYQEFQCMLEAGWNEEDLQAEQFQDELVQVDQFLSNLESLEGEDAALEARIAQLEQRIANFSALNSAIGPVSRIAGIVAGCLAGELIGEPIGAAAGTLAGGPGPGTIAGAIVGGAAGCVAGYKLFPPGFPP